MHNMERLNCTLQWQLKLLPQTDRQTHRHTQCSVHFIWP